MHLTPRRLKPGCDLRRALEASASGDGELAAFVVVGIGSLADATLRLAGADTETRLAGAFEIVCLSGTISRNGAHLHMVVADANGTVCGGHVCYGNTIRTTAEVLLARVPGWDLARAFDAATGFQELVVTPQAAT
jgi:predicted DNA-binding protein with PD1-like motif